MFDVHIPHRMEIHLKMANYDKLNADIKALSDKVDALLAKPAPEPVVIEPPDEQPAVDAADAAINDIAAKIP